MYQQVTAYVEKCVFVTGLDLVSTHCHFNYNPYLLWDWATASHWSLHDRWLSHHIEQSTCWR